jgi:hypothetical protein
MPQKGAAGHADADKSFDRHHTNKAFLFLARTGC